MTVAFILGILDLVSEFLTHTFILRDPLQPAGTITAGSFQPLFDSIHDFFIFIH